MVHVANGSSVATFVVNYLATLPLYMLTEYSVEENSLVTGEILGGVLYLSVWYAIPITLVKSYPPSNTDILLVILSK